MSERLDYKSIAEQLSQIPIDGFFDGFTQCLAHLLGVDCVVVSRASVANITSLQTESFFIDNRFELKLSYSIHDTPCRQMLNGEPFSFSGNIAQAYPDAEFLTQQEFVHYVGYPLLDCDNQPVGYIATYSRQTVVEEHFAFSVLKIASHRAVREFVRGENDKKMARLNQGLQLHGGVNFYQHLIDIVMSHGAIDAAFIGQLLTPNADTLRIKALGGKNLGDIKVFEALNFDNGSDVLSITRDAHQSLQQLWPAFGRQFEAAVIITLFDPMGTIVGYMGAISTQPLTNTEGILAMLNSFSARTEMEIESQNREYQLRFFNEVISTTDDLISFVDRNFCYRALNDAYSRKFGVDISELINQPIAKLHGEEKFQAIIKPSIEMALNGTAHIVEMQSTNSDGQDIYIHACHNPCFDSDGQVIGVAITARDVTELKRIELALADSEARLNILYNKTPSMFFTIDRDFIIDSVNVFGANKLGYDVDTLIGSNIFMLYSEDDKELARERFLRCFEQSQELHEWEIRQQQFDGRSLWVKQTAQVVNTPEKGSQIFLASEDISEKHRLSQKLSYQATHDSLTGLNNRLEFERSLRKLVKRKSEGTQQVHVLCYIDLDKFKLINDSCGHLAGDELLRNVADILSQCVRKSDVLARIGGDEFAILMEDCQLEKARKIAEKIREEVKDYVLIWKDKNYQIGASIGLTIFNLQRDSITQALTAADEACYAAKSAGRDKVFVFSTAGRDKLRHREEVEFVHILKRAIKQDEFEMYAQPIYAVNNLSAVVGYELLLRLNCNGRQIEAGKLLHSAQQHQLVTKIDEWVIAHGFKWLAKVGSSVDIGYCAMNISGSSAGDPEFLEYVLYQLQTYRVTGDSICFEITETATLSNLLGVTNFITELSKHGCRFTLDNFGSGISSFNHMKNLSFDMVKISDEYVSGLVTNDVDRAMVEAIVGICRAMGKISIAGVVKNKEIYQCLVDVGVDCVQGFYCGKPQPLLTIV